MPSDVEKRTLSPQDLLRIEREEEKTKKAVEAENDAREQLHLEREADNLGQENTSNGKRRRLSPKSNAAIIAKKHEEEDQQRIIGFFRAGAKIGDIGYGIGAFASTLSEGLRTSFAPSARQSHTVIAKDGSQILFEENIAVTLATQEAIERDQEILQAKVEEFMAISAKTKNGYSSSRARIALEIFNLADEFDMRRNPKTKEYVPSTARVAALEAIHNPHGRAICKGSVCTFEFRMASSVDSRGIKIKIGDQFDQNPAEIIASGDHLKGPNAPSLHIS